MAFENPFGYLRKGFEKPLRGFLDAFGLLLEDVARPWGRHLGAILRHFSAILAHLGTILAHLGAILAHLGAILAHLGPSWRYVGPSERTNELTNEKRRRVCSRAAVGHRATKPLQVRAYEKKKLAALQRGGCAKHLESAALPAAQRRVRSFAGGL